MLIQTKKGKRTRRSPKKFIARLCLDFCERNVEEDGERVSCVDQCENSSDGLSSEVLQGIYGFSRALCFTWDRMQV